MSARYTMIDGEVIAQERGGVRHQLVPDPLGSVVALYDDSGTKTDTFGYWPYGESSGRTGTTNVKFQFVGNLGYYQDGVTRNYIRARYLDKNKVCWITEDIIANQKLQGNIYLYVGSNPIRYTDATGHYCDIEKHGRINDGIYPICSVANSSVGRKCIQNCLDKYHIPNRHNSKPDLIECLQGWCRSPKVKCPASCTNGGCGESYGGSGSTGTVSLCPPMFNPKDPNCYSCVAVSMTIGHELVSHVCNFTGSGSDYDHRLRHLVARCIVNSCAGIPGGWNWWTKDQPPFYQAR